MNLNYCLISICYAVDNPCSFKNNNNNIVISFIIPILYLLVMRVIAIFYEIK